MPVPKMHLPSKIISREELEERSGLQEKLIYKNSHSTGNEEDDAVAYMRDWNRLSELNKKHDYAVLYVTRYN